METFTSLPLNEQLLVASMFSEQCFKVAVRHKDLYGDHQRLILDCIGDMRTKNIPFPLTHYIMRQWTDAKKINAMIGSTLIYQVSRAHMICCNQKTIDTFPFIIEEFTQRQLLVAKAATLKEEAKGKTGGQIQAMIADLKTPWSPELVRMSTVERRQVEWLWPGKIPMGKITMISGETGLGKSYHYSARLISRIRCKRLHMRAIRGYLSDRYSASGPLDQSRPVYGGRRPKNANF